MASVKKRSTAKGEPRYDVRVRVRDGTVRNRTFLTRVDARRYAATSEADKLRGNWTDPRGSARTFGEVAAEWLDSNPAKRSSSYARDESVLRVHLMPELGPRPLGTITSADARKLVAKWSADLAPRTVERNYGVLRAVLAYAVDAEMLGSTPLRRVKLPRPEVVMRATLTPDQLHALAESIGPDWSAMVYLAALLGLRWGECAGLRVGRLDLLAAELTIAEQVTRGRKGAPSLGPPKSWAGNRVLALPAPLVAAIAEHLTRRGLTGADTNEFVFADSKAGPLRYEHWRRRVWHPAVQAAGLDHLNGSEGRCALQFHDLRRTNATALVRELVDLKTAQARLGHSDPRLTLAVYAQASSEADRDASDRLAARFFGASRDVRAMQSSSLSEPTRAHAR